MRKTLQDLNLEYLDRYLIHFPISTEFVPIEKKYPPEWTNLDGKMVLIENDLTDTWKQMERCVSLGLVREIGVCNFNTGLFRQICNIATIKPSVVQVERHPLLTQTKLMRCYKEAGAEVMAFSPLGGRSYIPLDMADDTEDLLTNPQIATIAAHHRKTPAQILLRWALQSHTTPVCKSSSETRLRENMDVLDFQLFAADMEALNAMNIHRRFNDPGAFAEAAFGCFCPIYD